MARPCPYMFGFLSGPVFRWFAWYPVRTYYRRWVWLKWTTRVRVVKHEYLSGPDWEFWAHGL